MDQSWKQTLHTLHKPYHFHIDVLVRVALISKLTRFLFLPPCDTCQKKRYVSLFPVAGFLPLIQIQVWGVSSHTSAQQLPRHTLTCVLWKLEEAAILALEKSSGLQCIKWLCTCIQLVRCCFDAKENLDLRVTPSTVCYQCLQCMTYYPKLLGRRQP